MATEFLQKAKKNKADEFYTQMADIEEEMHYYKEQFQGKVVLCNCDDPYESNFFKYFAVNFNTLGLKQLLATSYADSPLAGQQLRLFEVKGLYLTGNSEKRPYKIEINAVDDRNSDGAYDLADVEYLLKNRENALTLLQGDGDFRSAECIELLKQADIVVTNPPFSLFREYVSQLMQFNKKFVIIGNKNAITYRDFFVFIAGNRVRTGYRNINSDMWFMVPDHYEYEKIEKGTKIKHIMACWFTNLDVKKHDEFLTLFKQYKPEEYPYFDNYEAINVDKVTEIPYDFEGVMGVPITFLDKHNSDQFEIIGLIAGNIKGLAGIPSKTGKDGPYINGKLKYGRILIKKIQGKQS